jgi:flagellar biogenesis protein FliO
MIEELLPRLVAALLLLAVFAWLMHELRKRPSLLRQLADEMHDHYWLGRGLEHVRRFRLPVYSAETVRGKEAEFIRDRLPIKFAPTLLIMVALLALVLALFWWVTR